MPARYQGNHRYNHNGLSLDLDRDLDLYHERVQQRTVMASSAQASQPLPLQESRAMNTAAPHACKPMTHPPSTFYQAKSIHGFEPPAPCSMYFPTTSDSSAQITSTHRSTQQPQVTFTSNQNTYPRSAALADQVASEQAMNGELSPVKYGSNKYKMYVCPDFFPLSKLKNASRRPRVENSVNITPAAAELLQGQMQDSLQKGSLYRTSRDQLGSSLTPSSNHNNLLAYELPTGVNRIEHTMEGYTSQFSSEQDGQPLYITNPANHDDSAGDQTQSTAQSQSHNSIKSDCLQKRTELYPYNVHKQFTVVGDYRNTKSASDKEIAQAKMQSCGNENSSIWAGSYHYDTLSRSSQRPTTELLHAVAPPTSNASFSVHSSALPPRYNAPPPYEQSQNRSLKNDLRASVQQAYTEFQVSPGRTSKVVRSLSSKPLGQRPNVLQTDAKRRDISSEYSDLVNAHEHHFNRRHTAAVIGMVDPSGKLYVVPSGVHQDNKPAPHIRHHLPSDWAQSRMDTTPGSIKETVYSNQTKQSIERAQGVAELSLQQAESEPRIKRGVSDYSSRRSGQWTGDIDNRKGYSNSYSSKKNVQQEDLGVNSRAELPKQEIQPDRNHQTSSNIYENFDASAWTKLTDQTAQKTKSYSNPSYMDVEIDCNEVFESTETQTRVTSSAKQSHKINSPINKMSYHASDGDFSQTSQSSSGILQEQSTPNQAGVADQLLDSLTTAKKQSSRKSVAFVSENEAIKHSDDAVEKGGVAKKIQKIKKQHLDISPRLPDALDQSDVRIHRSVTDEPSSTSTEPGLDQDIESISRMWNDLSSTSRQRGSSSSSTDMPKDDPLMAAIAEKMEAILRTVKKGIPAVNSRHSEPISAETEVGVKTVNPLDLPITSFGHHLDQGLKKPYLSTIDKHLEQTGPLTIVSGVREPGEGSSDEFEVSADANSKQKRLKSAPSFHSHQETDTSSENGAHKPKVRERLNEDDRKEQVEKASDLIQVDARYEGSEDSDGSTANYDSQYLSNYHRLKKLKKISFSNGSKKTATKEAGGKNSPANVPSPKCLDSPDSSDRRLSEHPLSIAYSNNNNNDFSQIMSPISSSSDDIKPRPKSIMKKSSIRSEGSERGSNLSLGSCSALGSHVSLDSADSGLSRTGSFPVLTRSDGAKKNFKISFTDIDMNDMKDMFKTTRKAKSEGAASEPESTDSDSDDETQPITCKNCHARQPLFKARLIYKLCHGCYTYYCSSQCRRLDWSSHKPVCIVSRLSSLAKKIFKRVTNDQDLIHHCSRFARTGYLCEGRGAMVLSFSSSRKAQLFLSNATQAEETALYLSTRDIAKFSFDDKRDKEQLLATCKHYHPDDKFVLHLAVKMDKGSSGQLAEPRIRGREYHKTARIKLSDKQHYLPKGDSPEDTLIITAVPAPGAELDDVRSREVFFASVQTKLRKRGISLRHQYPDVYNALCHYVISGTSFSPISLFAFNLHTQQRFMCCIMPFSEPEVSWGTDNDIATDLDLSMEI